MRGLLFQRGREKRELITIPLIQLNLNLGTYRFALLRKGLLSTLALGEKTELQHDAPAQCPS